MRMPGSVEVDERDAWPRCVCYTAGRDRWTAEYIGRQRLSGADALPMLQESIDYKAAVRALEDERKARGLMSKLHAHAAPLDFDAARRLLVPGPSEDSFDTAT